MPKPNAIAALADSLTGELTVCRAGGRDEYPVRVDRLADRLIPPPDPAAVLRAVGSKAFTTRAVVAVKARMDAPVALVDDLPQLAASPLTLEAALRAKGDTGTAPPWAPKGLAATVHKDLRADFLKAVGEWVETGELPSFAVAVKKGKTVALYHRDRPIPPPPSVQDAERLVDLLRRWKRPGEAVTLAELAATAGLTDAAFKKAVKEPAFTGAVTQVKVKPNDVLVVPGVELEAVVFGPLLTRLIDGCTRPDAHAFPVKELVALLSDKRQRQQVASVLNQRDFARELSPGVGCVRASAGKAGGQNVFFRLEHLRAARVMSRPAVAPDAAPADFATAFDAAFARLDREHGSNNFVSLVDLRAALSGLSREAFDAGVQQLRRERRYVLTSDERYDGLTPEQQAAAIREEGEFLLHVSRGRS